jgi:hypothetical protein
MTKHEKLLAALKDDLSEYTSIPFWSWNNELDEAELIRQIREFKEASIDAFFMHARTGLKTEYLGEKWFKCVEVCLSEAKKLGMKAWVYDENGWPSGFVGGKLLKDGNYVQKIEYEKKSAFDRNASAVYVSENDMFHRVHASNAKNTDYHCLYIKDCTSFTDILNPDVVTEFIDATHEEYYKRFAGSFGKELAGFFTDEPQYYRYATPYSRILPKAFAEENDGEDVFDGLILLFVDNAESKQFRYKYHALLNKLFTENYYKRIYDWCEAHNCKLTGHITEENNLAGQLGGCAGAMPTYEYEHIPAIDRLCNLIGDGIAPKQAASVAEQLGKEGVLSEMFAVSGWDCDPRRLRGIAEMQYVSGVNMMCQHLSPFSIKGQAKGDYPQFFSTHNIWMRDAKPFNEYFKRLGYILRNTRGCADTLVIHPVRSAASGFLRSNAEKSVSIADADFKNLTEKLTAGNVQFHYGDESIIKMHGAVSNGQFIVGHCSYKYVAVPAMAFLDPHTLTLIEKFTADGGKLCSFSPFVKGNIDVEEIEKKFKFIAVNSDNIVVSHRKGDVGEFLYMFNRSETEGASVTINEHFRVLNLETASLENASKRLTIGALGSAIAVFDKDAENPLQESIARSIDITDKFQFESASHNNLTLDFVQISFDGIKFEPPIFFEAANERLIKQEYSGDLWVKYCFEAESAPSVVSLLLEDLHYDSATLNGVELKLQETDFDVYFLRTDLSGSVQCGKNELVLKLPYFQHPKLKDVLYGKDVGETLLNCVVIDTELASVYIQGSFFVDNSRKIHSAKMTADARFTGKISGLDKLQEKGFAHFAGDVTYSGKLTIDAADTDKQVSLTLKGCYMTAKVSVNGRALPVSVLSDTIDLTGHLHAGENKVTINITSSMRNMFGPHHHVDGDPLWAGHNAFEFRGTWAGDAASDFTKEYNLVDFGLTDIKLILQ